MKYIIELYTQTRYAAYHWCKDVFGENGSKNSGWLYNGNGYFRFKTKKNAIWFYIVWGWYDEIL